MTHTFSRLSVLQRIPSASSLALAAWLAFGPVAATAQQPTAASPPLQPVSLRHAAADYGPSPAPYCASCQPGMEGLPPGRDYSEYQQPGPDMYPGAGRCASEFFFANTFGDFFGGSTGNNTSFRLDRLQVNTEFYSTLPTSPSAVFPLIRFSDTPVPFTVHDPANNTSSIATTGIAGFETTQSEQIAVASLSLFGRPPIVNDAQYQALANAAFISRNGAPGTTTYNQAQSNVGIVTPLVLPSFIDLNGNNVQDPGEYSVLGDSTSAFIDINGNTVQDPGEPVYTSPQLLNQIYTYDYLVSANLASPGTGGHVGRSKLADNDSPVPRDRLFFDYSAFYGVDFGSPSDVHRITLGFEKTFNCGNSSVEVRFPMASALAGDVNVDPGLTNASDVQFGNVTIYLKTIFHDSPDLVVSGGIGFTLPTADDSRLLLADGTPLVDIESDSIHFMPWVGFGYAPGEHFFMEGFCQFDFDCNGNPVRITDFAGGLNQIGVANDASYMFLSLALGYWTTARPDCFVTRLSPMFELHYNDPLQDNDVIATDFARIGTYGSDSETLNIVVGTVFDIRNGASTLNVGYVDSLIDGDSHQFNSELRVIWNTFF